MELIRFCLTACRSGRVKSTVETGAEVLTDEGMEIKSASMHEAPPEAGNGLH